MKPGSIFHQLRGQSNRIKINDKVCTDESLNRVSMFDIRNNFSQDVIPDGSSTKRTSFGLIFSSTLNSLQKYLRSDQIPVAFPAIMKNIL